MKKTMFLAIMAGAALAGCVKNEPIAMADGSPELITFDAPVVSVPTKATEIADNYPKDKDFAVYALYHVGNYTSFGATGTSLYMNNVTCTANKKGADETPDYWAPATDYYWPKTENAMLTFGAYAPVMSNTVAEGAPTGTKPAVEWGATGFKFNNYTVPTTSADQKDLLYSGRVYDQKSSDMLTAENKNPYEGVTIVFKHALSSIVFTATATEDDVVTLIGIKVNNVISTGWFDQGYPDDGGVGAENAKWTYVEPTAEPTAEPTRETYVVYEAGSEGGIKLSTNTKKYFDGTTTSDTAFDEVKGTRKSSLILIPQLLNTLGKEVTVTVTFLINGVKNIKTFKLAVGPDGERSYEWKMGFRYTYDISIGLKKIYFNPTVTPWTDKSGILL